MFSSVFFRVAFGRRFLFKAAKSALALLNVPMQVQAAVLPVNKDLTAAGPEADQACGGLVQIRVIGFGATGAVALERAATYPAPGLSFLQFESAGQNHKAIARALDCVNTVVLLVDQTDSEQVRHAMALGNHSKSQGLLTIGVALDSQNTATDLSEKAGPGDLTGSVHSFMRLGVSAETGMADHAKAVLRSLTRDLACMCNEANNVGVDYEDVLTILGEPAQLSVGTGMANGPGRAQLAAEMAVSKAWPEPKIRNRVKGLLVMVSGAPGKLRLKESQAAMNTVRHQFQEEAYCIYGVIDDEHAGDQLRVTVLATAG